MSAKANPDIKLDLEERPSASTVDAVLNKQADLGVIVRGVETDGLTLVDYDGDSLLVAAHQDHALARRTALTFADIIGEDLVSLENGTAVHRLLSERAREMGRFMRLRVQVRSFEVMCLMIGQGLGIGILPERAAQPLAVGFGLTLVPLVEPWARRQHAICFPANEELDPPSRRLIDHLTAGK
jgi:DNA-binding transcriptional LysR family regulator